MKRIFKTNPDKTLRNADNHTYTRWLLTVALLGSIIVSGFRTAIVRVTDDPVYREKIDQWHQDRVASLKSENGWLNLAGLFWLSEGKNSLGLGPAFDVAFPVDKAPADLGLLYLEKGEVRYVPKAGALVLANGKPITEPLAVFRPSEKAIVLAHGSLRWFIIKRGPRYGIRLRDLASPYLNDFRGIDRFPIDKTWRIQARLEIPTTPKTIPILDVLGLSSQQPLAGTLVFERAGKIYRLDAVNEGDELFILFGDATNAHETYGSGRFLYAEKPGPDGLTTLDFNKAINPPCAFTPYATCPLPPKQNKLTLTVNAGEKRYGEH